MFHKIKIIRVFFAAVVLAVAVFVCSCSAAPRDSLFSFVSVSNTGISGQGTASISIDWEGIRHKVLGSSPTGGTALEIYNEKAEDLENSLSFVLNKTSGLANGDIVTLTIVCTEKASIAYNIKMYESISVTLDGFLIQKEVDLFAGLDLQFTGYSPCISVETKNVSEDAFLKTITFISSKSSGLRIGEEIDITAAYSQELADSLGYVPKTTTKTFTVQNVPYYPYSYAELPGSLVKELTSVSLMQVSERWKDYSLVLHSVFEAENDRQAYLESKVTDIQIKDPVLDQIIVLSRKDTSGSWFGSYNYIFFLYKTEINNIVLHKETEIFQCVVFYDVFVNEEGIAEYSQWNPEKPLYETAISDDILTILQKDYSLYDCEFVSK